MKKYTLCLSLLLFYCYSVLGQEKQYKPPIDVYHCADSIFNTLISNGIDNIVCFHLTRYKSETYPSKDGSSDHKSTYIFWQTKDNCFIQKINESHIYDSKIHRRYAQSDVKDISTIFDYYQEKKTTIDTQYFRPVMKDLRTNQYELLFGDTSWLIEAFGCSDCPSFRLTYKIGGKDIQIRNWSSLYLSSENRFFRYNISSELYHFVLLIQDIMNHEDRTGWEITKNKK